VTYPKITLTADPRVRIACYGPDNWRTQVQDEPGADWAVTGPAYPTKAVALSAVDNALTVNFGSPTHAAVRSLRAQVERLTAENAKLQAKIHAERSHNGALMVDADRREQRALALLPDCEAHRQELQYLRHCVSWYWNSMNDSEDARHAIVGALGNTVLALERGAADPDGKVGAAELLTWLKAAIAKQNKPLSRHGYPSLADCLRSAAGECDHEGIAPEVKAEIAEALGILSV
jgi:hypothetical protein